MNTHHSTVAIRIMLRGTRAPPRKLLIHVPRGSDSRYGLIRQLSDIEKTNLTAKKKRSLPK